MSSKYLNIEKHFSKILKEKLCHDRLFEKKKKRLGLFR